MPTEVGTTAAVIAGVILLASLIFGLMPWIWDREPKPEIPEVFIDTFTLGPHAAPLHPYSVEEAHWAMQDHLDCYGTACRARAAAVTVLRETGRMVPAGDDR